MVDKPNKAHRSPSSFPLLFAAINRPNYVNVSISVRFNAGIGNDCCSLVLYCPFHPVAFTRVLGGNLDLFGADREKLTSSCPDLGPINAPTPSPAYPPEFRQLQSISWRSWLQRPRNITGEPACQASHEPPQLSARYLWSSAVSF